MASLDGRVAIVTGGARGIGRAYCLGLAREGCTVVVADLQPADQVAAEVAALGAPSMAIAVDVADPESTQAMATDTVDRFGRIDILVNNAGYFRYARQGPFTAIGVEEWDRAFAVNVRGSWLCARAVYPAMREQAHGRIINISSMTAWKGTVGFLHYVTSKAAIVGLTRGLAREIGGDGIAVNTVVPEFIPHDLEYAQGNPTIDERVIGQRVFQRTQVPDDMVGIVVFLAGPGADFITGQSFLVNGGTQFQ